MSLEHPQGVAVTDDWLLDRGEFETRCRESGPELAAKARAANGPEAALLFGRFWMRLIEEDESVCPHLARDGFWESWVSLAFARAVRPGAFVVDAGAHVGWFTLLALARGAARVFAVEPQPRPLSLLFRTLLDNGLSERVDFTSFALGSAWGAADLHEYGRLSGNASLLDRTEDGWTATGRLRVGVAPLDGILDSNLWRRVDLVKVDVEGAEAHVWDGMQATLARNPHAAVVMEVGADRRYALADLLARIRAGGFRVRKVDYAGDVVESPDDGGLLDRDAAGEWATLWIDRPEAREAKAA